MPDRIGHFFKPLATARADRVPRTVDAGAGLGCRLAARRPAALARRAVAGAAIGAGEGRRRSRSRPPPPPPPENPGLINEIGKLFEKSKSILPSLKSPSETIDDLNARAKMPAKACRTWPAVVRWSPGARPAWCRPMARRTARRAPTSSARARATRKARASTPTPPKNARRKRSPGPQARAGRLQDRKLRDPRALPVALPNSATQ